MLSIVCGFHRFPYYGDNASLVREILMFSDKIEDRSGAPHRPATCDACEWYRERLQQLVEQLKKCDAEDCGIAVASEQNPRYPQHRSKILRRRDAVFSAWEYHEKLHRC
jgi:hypothetical protein